MSDEGIARQAEEAQSARDYLVTVRRGQRQQKLIWPAVTPMLIDELTRWELRRTTTGVYAQQVDGDGEPLRGAVPVPIPLHALLNASPVALDGTPQGGIPDLVITVSPLKALRAPYELGETRSVSGGELAEHFLFCGMKSHLYSFNRVGSTFKVHVEGRLLFAYSRKYASLGFDGHTVDVHLPGLVLETGDGNVRELADGRTHSLANEEWVDGRLCYGDSWWRVVPVPLTEDFLLDRAHVHSRNDEARFWRTARVGGVIFAVLFLLYAVLPRKVTRREVARTDVQLKKPKRISTGGSSAPSMTVGARTPRQTTAEDVVRESITESEPRERQDPVVMPRGPDDERRGRQRSPERPGSRRGPQSNELSMSGKGQIPRSDLERTLQRHLSFFQECYERALSRNPRAAGVVLIEWTISGSGTVTDAQIAHSDIADGDMQTCLTEELRRTTFARPKGGAVHVSFPLVFTSAGF